MQPSSAKYWMGDAFVIVTKAAWNENASGWKSKLFNSYNNACIEVGKPDISMSGLPKLEAA